MTNETKQTAVEWIEEWMYTHEYFILGNNLLKAIEKAKEMEKEQMKLSDKNGYNRRDYQHDCEYGGVEYWDIIPQEFEEWHNKTYGGNKCQFEVNNNTSSATKCKNCGKEKYQHGGNK